MDDIRWAMENRLGNIACYAAVHLDFLIAKKPTKLEAVDILVKNIRLRMGSSGEEGPVEATKSILENDPVTSTVLRWVIQGVNGPGGSDVTGSDLVSKTDEYLDRLEQVFENPDSFQNPDGIEELKNLRDFCLNISRKASAYEDSLRLTQQGFFPG